MLGLAAKLAQSAIIWRRVKTIPGIVTAGARDARAKTKCLQITTQRLGSQSCLL